MKQVNLGTLKCLVLYNVTMKQLTSQVLLRSHSKQTLLRISLQPQKSSLRKPKLLANNRCEMNNDKARCKYIDERWSIANYGCRAELDIRFWN